MADNNALSAMSRIFDGIDTFVKGKTVIGDPIQVDDAVIIPLVDISCGMACGAFDKDKGKEAGGMYTKMSPKALLICQNGGTKLINVNNTDAVSKLFDFIPDVVNKFTGKNQISPKVKEQAQDIASNLKPYREES